MENNCIFLKSIAFAGYKSFGEQIQKLEDLSKINILIGPNNYGKSNILKIINEIYPKYRETKGFSLPEVDRPKPNYSALKFGIPFDESKLPVNLREKATNVTETIEKIIDKIKIIQNETKAWFYFDNNKNSLIFDSSDQIFNDITDNDLNKLWQQLTGRTGGGRKQHWEPETLKSLSPNFPSYFTEVIPAIRSIGNVANITDSLCGKDMIPRLADLQRPDINDNYESKKEQFRKINCFLKAIINKKDAEIEIPDNKSAIYVKIDEKVLPLESLGTGIHQVIIIATASTIMNGRIICIEEPELHLNPVLQKKLIRYLDIFTNNQYIITTHSASLMDTPNAEIYQVSMSENQSIITHVSSNQQKVEICNHLGYHPSDLLQANCVIWVEGPSDRIYLNKWIKTKNKNLIEGIHYSIMFYGGRLASHISGLDMNEIADDLISLKQLNRNSAIIIDSDKTSYSSEINQTKQRLKSEFNKDSGFCWITDGKEIENYIPTDVLREAINKIHPNEEIKSETKFSNPMELKNSGRKKKYANKVKVAQYIVESYPSLNMDRYDLSEKITHLIHFIESANPGIYIPDQKKYSES